MGTLLYTGLISDVTQLVFFLNTTNDMNQSILKRFKMLCMNMFSEFNGHGSIWTVRKNDTVVISSQTVREIKIFTDTDANANISFPCTQQLSILLDLKMNRVENQIVSVRTSIILIIPKPNIRTNNCCGHQKVLINGRTRDQSKRYIYCTK